MIDLKKILLNLVTPMVDDANNLEVREMPSNNENEIVLFVYAKNEDVARLIGRRGMMAQSLRQVVSVASRLEKKRITIKFESI